MANFIIKLDDYYLEWSTIVDAPTTFGMSLEEFKEYYRQMYGEEEMRGLDERLVRVNENGTSSRIHNSVIETITCNRASPDETRLTKAEIIKAYCLREPMSPSRLTKNPL